MGLAAGSPVVSTRYALAVTAGVWVGVWIAVLTRVGSIADPWFQAAAIAALVVCQAIPRLFYRRLAAIAVALVAIVVSSAGTLPAPRTVTAWWASAQTAVSNLLILHSPSNFLLTAAVTATLVSLYSLLLYSSQSVRLWLFYQICGLGALVAIHLRTPAVANWLILTLLAAALCGSAIISLEAGVQRRLGYHASRRLYLPAAMLLCTVLLVAAGLPKPIRNGPFADVWWKRYLADDSTLPTHRVGFAMGPQVLGGSLQTDYNPVLSVVAGAPAYLRGAVWTDYTGRAWRLGSAAKPLLLPRRAHWSTQTVERLPNKIVTQRITVLGQGVVSPVVFGAYALTGVQFAATAPQGVGLQLHPRSDTITMQTWLTPGTSYQVTSREPWMINAILDKSTAAYSSAVRARVGAGHQAELQLPPTFPQRDIQLAASITAGARTEVQMVDSIGRYLATHEHYATTHIPTPGPGQDYVDQFLFETHRGYCNNFSTAFATLLRAVGIPTRWVTGFTAGTRDMDYVGVADRYVVRNSDAHAWIEVYFPNFGWIPFDPTPGFHLPDGAGSLPQTPGVSQPSHRPPAQGAGSSTPPPKSGRAPASRPPSPHWRFQRVAADAGAGAAFGGLVLTWLWQRKRRRRRGMHKRMMRWFGRVDGAELAARRATGAIAPQAAAAAVLDHRLRQIIHRVAQFRSAGAPYLTIRGLASDARAAGLSASEYGTVVRLAEQRWYGSAPLTDDEERILADLAERWWDKR